MIRWYKELYTDEETKKCIRKIKRKIANGRKTTFYYCITIASNKENLFDIIYADEMLLPLYKKQDINIIGIASSRMNAVELVKDIVDEMYHNTGGFDVRTYFEL